jgi:hypothetical protein
MKEYIPYIVSIIVPIFTGLIAYMQANKKSKQDIDKLREEHKTNLEELEAKFQHEMEANEKEHNHKIELMEKEIELQTKAKKDSIGDKALEGILEGMAPAFQQAVLESIDIKGMVKQSFEESLKKK